MSKNFKVLIILKRSDSLILLYYFTRHFYRFSPIHIPSLPVYNSRRPDKASNFVFDYLKSEEQKGKNADQYNLKETIFSQNEPYSSTGQETKWSNSGNNGK